MKSIKISAIIMSLMMVCCLCLSCLEGSAGGSPTDSLGGDPTISASEREDSGSEDQTSSASGSKGESSDGNYGESDSGKEDETGSSGGESAECAHELKRDIVAATCTTVGGTVETCKKGCGYKKIYHKVLPTEHNIVKGVCVWCEKTENEIEWYEFKFHWAVGDDSKIETFKLDKQTEDIGEVLENKAWEITWKHRKESTSLNWAFVIEAPAEGGVGFNVDRSIAYNFAYWNETDLEFYKHGGQPGCGEGFDGTHYMNTIDCPGEPFCSVVGYRYGECNQCHYKEWLNDIPAYGHEYINEGGEEICQWCRKTRTEIENESV